MPRATGGSSTAAAPARRWPSPTNCAIATATGSACGRRTRPGCDLDALLGDPEADTAVYCCGPEPLLAAVEQRCASWRAGSLHTERFAPKDGADSGERTTFEVELARSARTLTVPEDKSILQVVEEAGIGILSSCQEGTCGTCETAVLGGKPDHRDSVLTDEEQAVGDTMMICVSRACGERLVLDL